jgi:ribosomal protein S18 acetylase RimI-like enzyme
MRPLAISVRPAKNGDREFIRELSVQVFSEYTPRAGVRALPMTERRGSLTLVAEWRGELAGFAVLVLDRPRASLDAIAVTDEARGHGVGRRLLAAVERLARENGAQSIELVTADANVAGLDLFLRTGFERVRRLKRYYPRGQDAQLLRKRI